MSASATLREVAQALRGADVSSAAIGDNPREVVTERDPHTGTGRRHGPERRGAQIAQRTAAWATTTSRVSDAARMMLVGDIRHLIVLAPDGNAAGMISMRDLFSILLPEY